MVIALMQAVHLNNPVQTFFLHPNYRDFPVTILEGSIFIKMTDLFSEGRNCTTAVAYTINLLANVIQFAYLGWPSNEPNA